MVAVIESKTSHLLKRRQGLMKFVREDNGGVENKVE